MERFDSMAAGEPWDLPARGFRVRALREFRDMVDIVADGRSHCLWFEGEAGTGKTASLDLLASEARALGCAVLRAPCPFPGEGDFAWPRILAGAEPWIPFDLPAPAGNRRRRSGLEPPEPAQRMRLAVAGALRAAAQRGPVVVAVDDLHRADADAIENLTGLDRQLLHCSILWCIAGEPLNGRSPAVALQRRLADARRLRLHTLEPWTAEGLRAILRDLPIDEERERLIDWLMMKTGGNPFLVREAIRSLLAARCLSRSAGGSIRVLGDLESMPVPGSLEEFVRARVSALPRPHRIVLRCLAALGGEGTPELVCAVGGGGVTKNRASLHALVAAGLVDAQPGELGTHRLRHDWAARLLIDPAAGPQDAALCLRAAAALRSERRLDPATRWARIARVTAQLGPAHRLAAVRASLLAARTAWRAHAQAAARAHAENARRLLGETGPGKDPGKLQEETLDLAGRIHVVAGPFAQGIEELERLRGLLLERGNPSRERLAEIDFGLGRAHRNLGRYEEALACFRRSLLARPAAGRKGERGRTQLEIAWIEYERGDYARALRNARQAARGLEADRSMLEVYRARNLEGLVVWAQGRSAQAASIFEDILQRIHRYGTVPLETGIWNSLGLALWSQGDLDAATRHFDRGRKIAAALGQNRGEAVLLGNLAVVEEDRGNLEAALRLNRQALRIGEALGDRRALAIGWSNLASIQRQAGRIEDACELAERALRESRAMGIHDLEAPLLGACAAAHRAAGRLDEAEEEARGSLRLSRKAGDDRLVAYAHEKLARILADRGRIAAACASMGRAKRAIALGPAIDRARVLFSEAEMNLDLAGSAGSGDVALRRRRLAAVAAARDALAVFERLGANGRVEATRRLLKALGDGSAPPPAVAAPAPGPAENARVAGDLRIRCFGPMRITTPDGIEMGPGDWGSHKARALFAYLLLHGSADAGVSRERLLEAIWPEAAMDTVENTFHATLALMRKAIAGLSPPGAPWAMVAQAGGLYRLQLGPETWIDCAAFEKALHDGDRWERHGNLYRALGCYRSAEVLYTADFLEDSYLGWTDRLRDRYQEDRLDLLLKLGVLSLHAWNPEEGLEYYRRLASLDPLDERACRLGMHAHALLGHRRAALDLYREFVKRLKEELDAVPEALTAETARCLRAAAPLPAIDARRGASLPPARSSVTGTSGSRPAARPDYTRRLRVPTRKGIVR